MFYLSVVAASRNDDHGGDPLVRTQIFINNFARQCEKYDLPAELILVDWNPVPDRPGLSAVLTVPPDVSHCRARVVTVPNVLHRRLKYADKLAFFQMIAKNVGIRRARGDFILATNIDIVFSDELIQFIGKQKLDSKKVYRVDRYDISSGLSCNLSVDETLQYAWANLIRTNRRYQPQVLLEQLYGDELFKKVCRPDPELCGLDGIEIAHQEGVWQLRPNRSVSMSHLHTNACGDFMLLSREGWEAIRGYPEFEAFSFNIDSMGLVAAHYGGYEEVSLLPPCVCFHIEHAIGSGWSPEGEEKLFRWLRDAEILNPEWPVLIPLVEQMRERGKPLEFNHSNWGMADFELPEHVMGDATPIAPDRLAHLALQGGRGPSAIQPEYDLDRLTLAHERRLAREQQLLHAQGLGLTVAVAGEGESVLGPAIAVNGEGKSLPGVTLTVSGEAASIVGSTVSANPEKVVLYIPDSVGEYSEKRTLAYHAYPGNTTTLVFRVETFAHRFPLRFDPCQCSGLIRINSIAIFDTLKQRIVWELNGRNATKLVVGGTATVVNHAFPGGSIRMQRVFRRYAKVPQPLTVISTGLDPQLIFPPLPYDTGFPLIISVEMNFVPCS